MTGAFRDAPTSAAKPIKPEASHTKPGRTLLQVKTKNKKNEVEERREEENLMMMILGDKVPQFYIYKLPIVRFSGCYWYNIV